MMVFRMFNSNLAAQKNTIMSHSKFLAGGLLIACFITACNNSESKKDGQATDSTATTAPASALKEETVPIQADGAKLISYLV